MIEGEFKVVTTSAVYPAEYTFDHSDYQLECRVPQLGVCRETKVSAADEVVIEAAEAINTALWTERKVTVKGFILPESLLPMFARSRWEEAPLFLDDSLEAHLDPE